MSTMTRGRASGAPRPTAWFSGRAAFACTVLLVALIWPAAARAQASITEGDTEGETIRSIGDVTQFAIPLAGLTGSLVLKDWQGVKQLTLAFGLGFATTHGTKLALEKARLDASNNNSYPSGHTMAAFTGAGFIQQRYGWKVGLPAYLAAGFTGYSRVRGQKHYADDVIAGAGIGLIYTWWLTTPYADTVELQPIAPDGGYGMMLRKTW